LEDEQTEQDEGPDRSRLAHTLCERLGVEVEHVEAEQQPSDAAQRHDGNGVAEGTPREQESPGCSRRTIQFSRRWFISLFRAAGETAW
jgi:hypothetical protein